MGSVDERRQVERVEGKVRRQVVIEWWWSVQVRWIGYDESLEGISHVL